MHQASTTINNIASLIMFWFCTPGNTYSKQPAKDSKNSKNICLHTSWCSKAFFRGNWHIIMTWLSQQRWAWWRIFVGKNENICFTVCPSSFQGMYVQVSNCINQTSVLSNQHIISVLVFPHFLTVSNQIVIDSKKAAWIFDSKKAAWIFNCFNTKVALLPS